MECECKFGANCRAVGDRGSGSVVGGLGPDDWVGGRAMKEVRCGSDLPCGYRRDYSEKCVNAVICASLIIMSFGLPCGYF